jgi:hypothetical protein
VREGLVKVVHGSPLWKHSELVLEKKQLIPALQRLFTKQIPR